MTANGCVFGADDGSGERQRERSRAAGSSLELLATLGVVVLQHQRLLNTVPPGIISEHL